MKENIAFIPARGGSKGIPGKNIKIFLGKPLIVHSIEFAKSAKSITEVFVSTDDEKIAEISSKAGAKIIFRPADISGDLATSESAIEHGIREIEKDGRELNIIAFLQCTSPYRPDNSLEKAVSKFIHGDFDSLLTISPTHRFFWKIDGKKAIPEYDFINRPRRQDLKAEDIRYIENGSFYLFTRKHFMETGNRLGGKMGYYIMDEEYSLEIDTELDFQLLEKLAAKE